MSNSHLPCVTANRALLLVEPEALGNSERAAQLDKSHYCVAKADNPGDIFLMRGVFQFSVAVLSDLLGPLALRASAQLIRKQWTKARIVILGQAPDRFEDHLYDEAVTHASNEAVLLSALDTPYVAPWNQQTDAFTTWVNQVCSAPPMAKGRAIAEIDPTKVPGPVREAEDLRASLQTNEGFGR